MNSMKQWARLASSCGVVAACVAVLPHGADAHETREVAGGYEFVVGFIDEPAYVGEKNGLFLEVSNPNAAATPSADEAEGMHGGGAPVLGLIETLQAEVGYGSETMELELIPSFDNPGSYLGYFFPTAEGDYTFRIFGEIDGVAVDESFTSSPEGFASVEPRLEFPSAASSGSDDGPMLGTLADISGGSSGGGGFGGGIALGLVALIGGGVAFARRGVGRFGGAVPVVARS